MKYHRQILLLLATIAGVVLIAATAVPQEPAQNRAPDTEHGKLVYYENCAACHNSLEKVSSCLTDDVAYFVKAGVPAQAMGTLLRKPVRSRPKGSIMPAYTPQEISDAELDDLGFYLASKTPPPKTPPAQGSAERGAKLYATNCASCHGGNGEGVGQMLPIAAMANQLKQGKAPHNVMLGFVTLACRSGSVPKMPTYPPEKLSDKDLADIAAHVWAMPMPAAPKPN